MLKKVLNYIEDHLTPFATLVFVAGVVVYVWGIAPSFSSVPDWLYAVPTAIISSLGMFVYQDDISELQDWAKSDSIYLMCYSFIHLAAAAITSWVVLKLIWQRLMDAWRLYTSSRRKIDTLYVFWGINERSMALAESCLKQRGTAENDQLVFVNTTADEGDTPDDFTIGQMLDIVNLDSNTHDKIKAMGALLTSTHVPLSAGQIHTKRLRRMMARARHINFFLLGDDENVNIADCQTLRQLLVGRTADIYCHARRSAKTRKIEISTYTQHNATITTHIVDSSSLAVLRLKQDADSHPVCLMQEHTDTTTATMRRSLQGAIIGFGEVGQEAYRFLYEYGAFVDGTGHRLEPQITVFDNRASAISGRMKAFAPLATLCTVECDIDSEQYWERMSEEITHGLQYVVVAPGNDDLALQTAVDLAGRAMVIKQSEHSMLIMVRCMHTANKERMIDVVSEMNHRLRNNNIELRLFGDVVSSFTFDTIVNDTYLQQAKRYNEAYYDASHIERDIEFSATGTQKTPEQIREDKWRNAITPSDKSVRGLNIADYPLWAIEDMEFKVAQNISNSMHSATKLYLLRMAGIDITALQQPEALKRNIVGEDSGYASYGISYENIRDERVKTVLLNLARLEHERWMSAAILYGQTLAEDGKKDVAHKRHIDLVPWDELRSGTEREAIQGYDCAMVDTTILLAEEQ